MSARLESERNSARAWAFDIMGWLCIAGGVIVFVVALVRQVDDPTSPVLIIGGLAIHAHAAVFRLRARLDRLDERAGDPS